MQPFTYTQLHTSLDFNIGLPPSEGNNVILTLIDRFSNAAHLIHLVKIPTAFETAHLQVQHVFRIQGIPTYIVSDQGPQLISQVWKAFCNTLGASSSLTFGYHPSPMVNQTRVTKNWRLD